MYPGVQRHWYPPTLLTHVAPFLHGLFMEHSFTSKESSIRNSVLRNCKLNGEYLNGYFLWMVPYNNTSKLHLCFLRNTNVEFPIASLPCSQCFHANHWAQLHSMRLRIMLTFVNPIQTRGRGFCLCRLRKFTTFFFNIRANATKLHNFSKKKKNSLVW